MSTQKTATVGLAITVAAIFTLTIVLAAIQSYKTVPVTGVITAVNVELYQDSACTQTLSSWNLGNVTAASSTNRTIYVKNTGNTPVSLNMTVNAWTPSNASNYMAFTWNQEGTVLNAGNNVATLLTLTVSPSITGITNFGFNMTITGTQI